MELDSQEVSDTVGSSGPFPMFLPVNYQVWDAEYFLLKEAGQDFMRNSSMQSHTQSFVILRAERPPVVNASYGPLSTEEEIPLDLVQSVQLFKPSPPVFTFNWKVRSFVLTRWVYSSSPKVRVLFYVAGRDWDRGSKGTKDQLPCVTVYAFWQTQEVRGSCLISNERGTCMAEVEPPAGWFSPNEGAGTASREKQGLAPGNPLELYYQAQPSNSGRCSGILESVKKQKPAGGRPQVEYVPVTPMQRIGSVRLLQVRPGATPVSVLRLGESVVIQTSSKPLRKTDIASFYIYMRSSANLDTFSLRAMVKKGVSFRTATPSNTLLWEITLDTGSDGSVGVICQKRSSASGKRLSKLQAILQMDFEVEDVSSQSEIQVIKWELALPDDVKMLGASEGLMRIYTTQRDFVGLAPLVMDTELMNTAVLTGKRVVVPVRTVAVEADGSVTDVSDFTDCSSTDEDVLKVSDSCDYVYVNGKEMKGRVRMLVNFTYSYLSAQLEMKVWIPRLPLDIEVSDTELSQIKNWRIPITSNKSRLGWSSEEERKGRGCMLQFQHALVRVLTHFVAEQPDPRDPREPQAVFLGSDWLVDVTKLVRYFMKVEDPNVARLHAGRVLSGRDVGTTSIKVLSPLSDSVLAERTVKVLDDRVSITELGLQLVSALTLSLQLSTGSNRAISATATTQEVLSMPKQEALLSSWLQFSDGSLTPLDIYDPTHYRLTVTSLDEGVVSIRDSPLAVVAEGEGQGALVRTEMTICEVCQKTKRKSTLAVGSGSLTVKFQVNSRRVNSSSNNSVDGSGTGSISAGNGKDNSSDYGNDGEESDGEKKQKQPGQIPRSSSASEREESALRKITTTTKSTSRDSSMGSIANDPEAGGANDAAGVGKSGNILNNENVLSPARPGRDSSTRNLNSGISVTESTGKAPGNLLNYNNYPAQVEIPDQGSKNNDGDYSDGETEGPLSNRPLTDLEIGMYALLCVFCLAILVFLVNCVSYLVKFRHKQPPSQAPEHTGHRHDWVWLGTDAELVMNVPGSPLQQDTHSTTVIDIGPNTEPCGTLTRRTSCQVASVSGDANVGCVGSLKPKQGRSESLHSPTSKRKRVQFTTFASLDRQNSPGTIPRENGHGIQWVGKEENCGTPEVPRTDSVEQL
ncbi:transmembrane protein 132C [Hoplias malabaricus]|uniref:transmembrane protein 132C n=1 Tax=Hoplias malabaricus TaxID=27720 RepID=UPI003462FA59